MTRSSNIYLVGPIGAGKTTIGKCLANELKMDFYDSDLEIEKHCGAELSWILDLEGEEGFRKREENIIEKLTDIQGIVLATGADVIKSSYNRMRLASRGSVIYLNVSIEQQLNRTLKDKKRHSLQELNMEEKINTLNIINNERSPLYKEIADYVINTDGRSVKLISHDIISIIS
jgi:shikimate kinase